MNILITGAGGFIGKNLVCALVEQVCQIFLVEGDFIDICQDFFVVGIIFELGKTFGTVRNFFRRFNAKNRAEFLLQIFIVGGKVFKRIYFVVIIAVFKPNHQFAVTKIFRNRLNVKMLLQGVKVANVRAVCHFQYKSFFLSQSCQLLMNCKIS